MHGGIASEHFFKHLFAGVFLGPPHSRSRTLEGQQAWDLPASLPARLATPVEHVGSGFFEAAIVRAFAARCNIEAGVNFTEQFFVGMSLGGFFCVAEKILPFFSSAFHDASP